MKFFKFFSLGFFCSKLKTDNQFLLQKKLKVKNSNIVAFRCLGEKRRNHIFGIPLGINGGKKDDKNNLVKVAFSGYIENIFTDFTIYRKIKHSGRVARCLGRFSLITGMFNTEAELIKYKDSIISTKEGIRGIIGKSDPKYKRGDFMVSFSKKINKGEKVYINLCYPIFINSFFGYYDFFSLREDNIDNCNIKFFYLLLK